MLARYWETFLSVISDYTSTPTSAESLKALERATGGKDAWVCLGEGKRLPCLTFTPCGDRMSCLWSHGHRREISSGHITLDGQCEFCRTLATPSWIAFFFSWKYCFQIDQKGLFGKKNTQVTGRGDLEDSYEHLNLITKGKIGKWWHDFCPTIIQIGDRK